MKMCSYALPSSCCRWQTNYNQMHFSSNLTCGRNMISEVLACPETLWSFWIYVMIFFFCYLSRTPGLLQCNCNIKVTLLYQRDAFCFADWRIRYYPQPVGGIEPITERDFCIIFCRSVSGFVNGCPCGVWCYELTTYPCMWFHFLAKLFWYWETYMRRFSSK